MITMRMYCSKSSAVHEKDERIMRDRKKYCFLLLGILCMICNSVFAADLWLERSATSYSFDVGSNQFWKIHGDWIGSGANKGNGRYTDAQLLGVIGVQKSIEETTVTISSNFMLTSDSDSTHKRPFGICLVPRIKPVGREHVNYKLDSTEYPMIGFDGTEASLGVGIKTFDLPVTDSRTMVTNGGETYAVESAWIDVVLVLDPVLDPSSGMLPGIDASVCNVVEASDYTGSVGVVIESGGQSQSMVLQMNGYYKTKNEYSAICQLTVIPYLANTNSFDLKSSRNTLVKVADIDFTTPSQRSGNDPFGNYYLFVSSSNSASSATDKFYFKRRNSATNLSEYNSAGFEVVAQEKNNPQNSTTFTGTDVMDQQDGATHYIKANHIDSNAANGVGKVWEVSYHGELFIKVIDPVDKLLAGAYDTNIYIHVISSV